MTCAPASKNRAGLMMPRHAELVEKISAFVETLLDDPDAATVRATIGAFASAGGALTGPVQQPVVTLTAVSNTFTPDCSLTNEFDCGTIGANSTIANPTNVPASGKVQPISIKWTQNGTGGYTMSFGANCINVGGTVANTAAGKTNFAVGKVYSDGKFYYSIVRGA